MEVQQNGVDLIDHNSGYCWSGNRKIAEFTLDDQSDSIPKFRSLRSNPRHPSIRPRSEDPPSRQSEPFKKVVWMVKNTTGKTVRQKN